MSDATTSGESRSQAFARDDGRIAVDQIERPHLWAATAAAAAVSIVPALLLAQVPTAVALAAASLLGLGLASWGGPSRGSHLVLALIPVSLVANSTLLPATTYFLPTATLGLAIVGYCARQTWSDRRLPDLPSAGIGAFAVLYLLAAAIATLASIQPSTSITYVVGMTVVVAVTLWLGPWLLGRTGRIGSLLVLAGATGLAATIASAVLIATGPILWFGRWLGGYLANELTIRGEPTGIVLLRASGPFESGSVHGLALATALLCLLALRQSVDDHWRRFINVAVLILMVGLLTTLARASWAAVIVGSAVLTIGLGRRKRLDVTSALVCLVFCGCMGAMLVNLVGADYRPDLTESRDVAARQRAAAAAGIPLDAVPPVVEPIVPPGIPGSDGERFPVRGGSDLSGRLELWAASARAIADSPWLGYGPGTNALALEPYVADTHPEFVGLSSHNTWLRTWIEMGIVGVAALTALVAVAVNRGRQAWARSPVSEAFAPGAAAIFLGLLVAQQFETFLLGGVGMPALVWSTAAGVLALRLSPSTAEAGRSALGTAVDPGRG